MARPRKNPVPTEAVTTKDTAAQTEAKTAADAVETAVKELAAEAKTAKKAAGKAAGRAADTAKAAKTETKRTVKKAAEKAEKKVGEVKRAARTAKNSDTAIIIQFEGKNIEARKVAEAAKARWAEAGKKESAIKSLELYINVTEGMAYPVINGEAQEGFYCC